MNKDIMFPTATEMYANYFLENLKEKMYNSSNGFIDITLCNSRIEQYLRDKGYTLVEIRYDYKDNKWGFWGRFTGDGHCLIRVIWDTDIDYCVTRFGNFK